MGDTANSPRFILYINKSYSDANAYCPGSEQCMQMLDKLSDEMRADLVTVQNMDGILRKRVELPAWLDGSPCLVDTATSSCLKGSAAVAKLRSVIDTAAATQANVDVDNGSEDDLDARATQPTDDSKVTQATVEALMRARQLQDERREPPKNHTIHAESRG